MSQTLQDILSPPTSQQAQPQALEAAAQAAIPQPVQVGWVASADTLERLGRAINPLAVGLVDELVKLTAVVEEPAQLGDLPSPPVEVLTHRRPGFFGLFQDIPEDLIESLRRQKVQLLHALEVSAWPMCRRLAGELNCPCLLTAWALGDADRLGRLGPPARGVVAVSEPIRRQLVDRRVMPADRVHLVRPGMFQVRHASCFADPQCSVSIVISGSLDVPGPFETVLKSVWQLQARQYDCVDFIIGNGRSQKRLRAMADKLNLRRQLTFVDRQPARQVAGILKAADVYIMPAVEPDLPMEALAAQAAGVPVVFNSADAADFLIDAQTALRFDPAKPDELTQLLVKLLSDRPWARHLAEQALEHLRARHGVGAAVANMAQLYRRTVNS